MWSYNQTVPSDELYHYGIKGMKWGVRKQYHKGMAKIFDMNAKVYKKSNKTLSSMNAAERNKHLKKVNKIQKQQEKERNKHDEQSYDEAKRYLKKSEQYSSGSLKNMYYHTKSNMILNKIGSKKISDIEKKRMQTAQAESEALLEKYKDRAIKRMSERYEGYEYL